MWFQFWKKKKTPLAIGQCQWIVVPLGNPGDEYAHTRHNLGRLLLQRWMDNHSITPTIAHKFYYGTLYSMTEAFLALVPSTYMNLSGKVVAEAIDADCPIGQMIVLYDDKDLPLGTGRLANSGSSGGHNGIQSVMGKIGTNSITRLRLGIGQFKRPLQDWVLGEWSDDEWCIIEQMDIPFAEFMSILAGGATFNVLQSRVNSNAFWQKKHLD